jgi:6-phosphogluconolactonase
VRPEIVIAPDPPRLAGLAADRFVEVARAAAERRERVSIALAGGRTPLALYRRLSAESLDRLPWTQLHFFWGDERCVPPEHPESNYRAAFETLIAPVAALPRHNVHRILGELVPPPAAAEAYEELLREFFAVPPGTEPTSATFDLVLLGLGPDGHTASLFPGDPAAEERRRWVVAVGKPLVAPRVARVTLTLPALGAADRVFFVVEGIEKRNIVAHVLREAPAAELLYPPARVKPRGAVTWLLDEAAAALLPEEWVRAGRRAASESLGIA